MSGESCSTTPICDEGLFAWSGKAYCVNGEWAGNLPSCQQPSGGFGHLAFTTSDGALFAYHKVGVLRLWKSEPNNMELQVRTLAPGGIDCEATLIAQVALRAADQVVSVVGSEDIFDIRVNGARVNLTEELEYRLGSGPDELMMQLRPTKLIVTSKRGAKFDFNFYQLTGMSWLSTTHVLNPNTFLGNTQGLLGIYDDDPLNDFTLRNGTQLPVATLNDSNGAQTEFGNSWLLDEPEWLFGAEENDIADADVEYLGLDQTNITECPTDFSNYSVPACDILKPLLVQVCYFDVIVGGPQFLDDLEYKEACANNTDQYCSFHGGCAEDGSECLCFSGWQGDNCEERDCPQPCVDNPNGGQCHPDTGFCLCAPGWTGESCEIAADCASVDNCNAAIGGGVCVDDGLCECTFGFLEPNCTAPTPMPTPLRTGAPSPTPTLHPSPMPTPVPTRVPTTADNGNSTPVPTRGPTVVGNNNPTPAPPTPAPDSGTGGEVNNGGAGAVPGWGIALILIPILGCCCVGGFFGYRAYKRRQENAEFAEKDVHAGFDDKPVTRDYDDSESGGYDHDDDHDRDDDNESDDAYYSSDLSADSASDSGQYA